MTCLFLTAALVVIVDRLAKYLVFSNLLQDQSIEVIPKLFHITLVLNTGAAFGIFKNFTAFFAVSSFFVITLIGVYAWRCKIKDLFLSLSLGLILGGAIANLIDRLIFGYVIDFLDFRIWPVFNIADSCVTMGSVILAWKFIFWKRCSTT